MGAGMEHLQNMGGGEMAQQLMGAGMEHLQNMVPEQLALSGLKTAFRRLDRDGNGRITKDELAVSLPVLGNF